MDFVAIDFEASCLPRHGRSFPIEVAISGPEGTRSWLIRPHASWRDWDWTEEATRRHCISADELDRKGVSPRQVVQEITKAVCGRRLFADSTIDAIWWATLHADAGIDPLAPIEHASLLVDALGAGSGEIAAAKKVADCRCPGRHRAGPDAAWLWQLLSELERIVLARSELRRAA
ncbi:hypothetical protein PX699_22750 [Sphingobium sp. H39-3-25]|uniref:hypothetical protein n=1 Tax=Sphingomonadales TaxID=204457 RepID=UPI00082BD4D4|nr:MULTISPECIES: hypothetical protein [Sphingomonadaceae]MDF0491092.1 hypothetical protein [Sphingomonas pollutisoli]MDF0545177.1 hypothetical protein [Sphingobium arseniciresistens]